MSFLPNLGHDMANQLDRLTAALADRYTIERELGEGGMATVYLAEDIKHHRKVAIKLLKPELAAVLGAERFVQEITTTAALQHPHILPLFDSGTADGFLFYVMPFIDGETLRDKLNRETQFSVSEAVKITTEVADALHYAHTQGVVHRDIKPENILISNGRPMVADFGIALAVSAAAGGRMTETGLSLGTPHYMSPEQATAEKEIDARSDVYSIGSVLYEMLTGSPPHTGASAQQIIMKIVTEDADPVTKLRKSVPPNVADAVAKSIEKLPADRFESAAAFSAALTNPGFTVAGLHVDDVSRSAGISMVQRLSWGIAGGLGVLAFALGVLLLRQEPPDREVVRFELLTPPSHSLRATFTEGPPFALSPDGTRIVYVSRDSGEAENQLYVRRLDQLEGSPLQGTEDAVAPFFSPDGRWVAFTTEETEELRKVPISGGPPITLAQDVINNNASGSWGDDNTIVYVHAGFQLWQVSGAGGLAARVSAADSSVGRRAKLWPQVLPGGKAILYSRCDFPCDERDLSVLDRSSGEVTVLVPGATAGWYLRSGQLLYATDGGTVYVVPFDVDRLEVTGDPVPVLDDLRSGVNEAPRLAIADSVGTLIYLSGDASQGREMMEVDRSGRATPVLPAGHYSEPRWSPTEDRIAMSINDEDGQGQIWIWDLASETLSQLTTDGGARPSWSPSGDRVTFWADDTTDGRYLLYWIASDGSGTAELVFEDENMEGLNTTFWTRDGDWILVDGRADSSQDQEDIFAIGTGADRSRQVVVATGADEQAGAVSPDGKWVAHGSTEAGRRQIYIRPFLAPGGRYLVSSGQGATALWASNDELVYIDLGSRDMISAKLTFGATVRVERTVLFNAGNYHDNPSVWQFDVSRDGQRFLMLQNPGSESAQEDAPIVILNWFEEVAERVAEQGVQ